MRRRRSVTPATEDEGDFLRRSVAPATEDEAADNNVHEGSPGGASMERPVALLENLATDAKIAADLSMHRPVALLENLTPDADAKAAPDLSMARAMGIVQNQGGAANSGPIAGSAADVVRPKRRGGLLNHSFEKVQRR